jgi:DNA-3-methyladenine glycosylase
MGLNLNHNDLKLDSEGLHLLPGTPVPDARVERGPRIGVEYAGAWAAEPFRLWDRDSGHVSRFVSRRPRRRP